MQHIILVCGGRDYTDHQQGYAILDLLHSRNPISFLIHGDARGADRIGSCWATLRNIQQQAYPADWNRHGKSAGYRRNEQMINALLNEKLVHGNMISVLALPGGKGTAHTVSLAKKFNIPLHNYN